MTDTVKLKEFTGRDPIERSRFLQAAIDGIARFEQRARILDPDFVYTPAAATDITKTWRKFGWVPLSEQVK